MKQAEKAYVEIAEQLIELPKQSHAEIERIQARLSLPLLELVPWADSAFPSTPGFQEPAT